MNVDILETGLRTKVLRKKQTKKKTQPYQMLHCIFYFQKYNSYYWFFLQEYIIGEAVPFFFPTEKFVTLFKSLTISHIIDTY